MNKVYTIFAELLKLCPRYQFERATERYKGDRYVKTFTTWQQYIAVLYSQITQKDSLRDIETGLATQSGRWYHLGLRGIHRSTLSDANTKRDYRIFEDMFYHLLARCRDLTPPSIGSGSQTPSIRSTRPPLICACRCFPGRSSGRPRAPSRCIASMTTRVPFRPF